MRSKTDGFPFILQSDDFLGLVFPGSEVGKFAVINGLDDFANYGLLVEIMLLGLFQGFKMLLVTAVHSSRSCFEACPYFIAQLFGYRSCIAEFLMQFLQLMESGNNIRFVCQFLGSFAKVVLDFKILLEVIFTEFVV